jgi:hypothetical protein
MRRSTNFLQEVLPIKRRLDISPCLYDPRFPHFATGIRIQQLTTKAIKMITWVHHGVRKRSQFLRIADQSKERFIKPIPPAPLPIKLAIELCGATQHRKAIECRNGKTYSGRNCHEVMKASTKKKTFICFWDDDVGFRFCFF